MSKLSAVSNETIVVMVSLGNRTHLSDYTYPRLASWAATNGYSSILLKKGYEHETYRSPHFAKLMVHKILPNFKRYIIVDDDIIMSRYAPKMEEVPPGHVGLVPDAVQQITTAKHVTWNANSGFIVCDQTALALLEKAYADGEYHSDEVENQIWGPFDQGILNDVLFKANKIYKLDWRWNYQAVIDFYSRTGGWERWKTSKFYRISYYISLVLPFSNNRKLLLKAFGIHMTMGLYPRFFDKIYK
ncbi:glycosyltransferase family protein [Pedobacter sandarakinus]|uniref:hypothetical protein n=1 Tax=Pedobacter sandarakinus TaxID=353156 RepID=UPI0022482E9D|nr:hypothetical protein [Pedobacter sandarakinus]MCX2575910.1 hypothetical protein [Pedobacter sandarakinus]